MSRSEPLWKTANQALLARPPAAVRGWLLDPASLTRRIRTACPGQFRVEVLSQRWERPRLHESQALNMKRGELALIREVHLYCGKKPVVYARTVIPTNTMTGPQRQLRHLGNKPLGAFLFAQPGMKRCTPELVCLQPGQGVFDQAVSVLKKHPKAIWGRRSRFELGGKSLLVAEVFLPDMPEWKTANGYQRV